MKTSAFADLSAEQPLVPFSLDSREPRPDDVVIEILYYGVCHSDLLTARNDRDGQTILSCRSRNCGQGYPHRF